MRAVGHPEKYPEFASKVCPACLEERRGRITMLPWFMRSVAHDKAYLVYQCPRCVYVDDMVAEVPLEIISHPTGLIFA